MYKDYIGRQIFMTDNKKLLFLISLGSILEYYDYAVFIYLAPVIGQSLIPIKNELVNLILSFAIFAIGAFFRPIGGLIFAHIGDTSGRSRTFIYTILFMAIPTAAIAFIPNVSQIGVFATILLILFRVLQGMAIGGEVPGSIVFGYETSIRQYRALSSSVVVMGTNIGFLLASVLCMFLMSMKFSFDSWRVAFILGGIFGIISYFLRKKLIETSAFTAYKDSLSYEVVPIWLLLKNHQKSIWQLLAIGAFMAASLAVFTFYMPVYLSTFYHLPLARLLELNSYTIIIFIFGSLVAGVFHKYFGKNFLLIFILVFSIFVIWLFNAYSFLSLRQILILHVVTLLGIGIVCGRLPVLCAAFFPVSVRYTGVALVYNISFGLIAGTTQVILTWLIKITGWLWMPALYLLVFGLLMLLALSTMNRDSLINYND